MDKDNIDIIGYDGESLITINGVTEKAGDGIG